MMPLMIVFAAEYVIQAGIWSSMGFPATDPSSRHLWYKYSNFMYQVGVFVSRSVGGLIVLNRLVLWLGPLGQSLLLISFYACAATSIGGWWLLLPALCVGFLGGFVYVQAFVLINKEIKSDNVELALATASLGDTLGIIVADAASLVVQGCLFGRLGITDTTPAFSCGYSLSDRP
eukprot:TRINITY_DN58951_c0_g1_i1.p1 TRINITY_DN58951_c0_g1~~TRINITY_DN58951_c0_g1_i1.p1  ORF type:complete len:175 (-),score=10.06 TRINITY_DN58951_c0_g1_i1:41-565(-)